MSRVASGANADPRFDLNVLVFLGGLQWRRGLAYNRLVLELYLSLFCPVDLTTQPVMPTEQVVVERFNETCHRTLLLEHVFETATAGADTEEARVRAWAAFLHRRFAYPPLPPIDEEGQAVYDPLWLLDNGLASCGQVNRVLVDGLAASGYTARLIQLHGHVGAEVMLDGKWRYIDAYAFENGQLVPGEDGTAASAIDINRNPTLLHHTSPVIDRDVLAATFGSHSQSTGYITPYEIRKIAPSEQLRRQWYGWNWVTFCKYDGTGCDQNRIKALFRSSGIAQP